MGPAAHLDHLDDDHQALRWWRAASQIATATTGPSSSLERRWFGRGEPPSDLARWLRDVEPAARTDAYAVIDRGDLSVKRRGVERAGVKWRQDRVELGDGLAPAERWARVGARLAGARPSGDEPAWLPVHKRRARRLVHLGGAEPLPVARRRGSAPRGGAVELVRLEVPTLGVHLWSVAAEAWGDDDGAVLLEVMRWSAIEWAAIERDAWMVAAYPAALLALRRGELPL